VRTTPRRFFVLAGLSARSLSSTVLTTEDDFDQKEMDTDEVLEALFAID